MTSSSFRRFAEALNKLSLITQRSVQGLNDNNRSLSEDIEEYRLKRLSKEFTFFGGVRD